MGWCDPCAADPLSREELPSSGSSGWAAAGDAGRPPCFITRLHVRYDGEHFPEDLVFQETSDRENFQGRYVLRHAYEGEASCKAADTYREELRVRRESEAQTLASLTGWNVNDIRKKTNLSGDAPDERSWWERLWKKS